MEIFCQNMKFDPILSKQRITRANQIIGAPVIKRILCFSLYLPGITRTSIAKISEVPLNSVKTTIKNIHNNGIIAFEDRRFRNSTFLPQQEPIPFKANVKLEGEWISINLGQDNRKIKIPQKNKLQLRTILLTLLNAGLLSTKETSLHLQLSDVQTRILAKRLEENDIDSLQDHRQGQKKEYVVSPEIKTELIQQFVANVVSHRNASSQKLADDLKQRCNFDLSSRTIRFHLEKSGLSGIKRTLPVLIDGLKKNSKN